VYRASCALKLNHVCRTMTPVPTRDKVPLNAPPVLNDTWAMDFIGDTLYITRQYRVLNVIDEGNREAFAIKVDVSLPSERVVAVLSQLVAIHGAPRRISCDIGPEFVAEALRVFCAHQGIQLALIETGKTYSEGLRRTV
jgi:putative transposase